MPSALEPGSEAILEGVSVYLLGDGKVFDCEPEGVDDDDLVPSCAAFPFAGEEFAEFAVDRATLVVGVVAVCGSCGVPKLASRPRIRGASRPVTRASALVLEQVDQFGSLPVAEAGDCLRVGDAAMHERAVGAGGAGAMHSDKQLDHTGGARACGRVGEDACQLDHAGGEVALELRARAAHFVRLRERAQPLLGRAGLRAVCAPLARHGKRFYESRGTVAAMFARLYPCLAPAT